MQEPEKEGWRKFSPSKFERKERGGIENEEGDYLYVNGPIPVGF